MDRQNRASMKRFNGAMQNTVRGRLAANPGTLRVARCIFEQVPELTPEVHPH